MKSNYDVTCPHCETKWCLCDPGDNWNDDFLKDGEPCFTECYYCESEIIITPKAIWSYSVVKVDDY